MRNALARRLGQVLDFELPKCGEHVDRRFRDQLADIAQHVVMSLPERLGDRPAVRQNRVIVLGRSRECILPTLTATRHRPNLLCDAWRKTWGLK
jgi:hypothetical protein